MICERSIAVGIAENFAYKFRVIYNGNTFSADFTCDSRIGNDELVACNFIFVSACGNIAVDIFNGIFTGGISAYDNSTAVFTGDNCTIIRNTVSISLADHSIMEMVYSGNFGSHIVSAALNAYTDTVTGG